MSYRLGRAQYKGSGTINGSSTYTFIFTAIDGQVNGGGTDKFQVNIWNKATGAVIYDNRMGACRTCYCFIISPSALSLLF